MPLPKTDSRTESVREEGTSLLVSSRNYCVQQDLFQLNDKLSYVLQALRWRWSVLAEYKTYGGYSLFPHFFRGEKRISVSGDRENPNPLQSWFRAKTLCSSHGTTATRLKLESTSSPRGRLGRCTGHLPTLRRQRRQLGQTLTATGLCLHRPCVFTLGVLCLRPQSGTAPTLWQCT